MNTIARLFLIAVWICGVVIAKGLWSTLFAFFIPFWAWYLVAERLMAAYGVLS